MWQTDVVRRLPEVVGQTEDHKSACRPCRLQPLLALLQVDQRLGVRQVYLFPKQELVYGPRQIEARIDQDPGISQQLTLWNQRGSGVRFGNLLVIPVNEAIVYVQPLYLQAEQTAMPQLTRVIVAYGDRVAMEPDLESALNAVFGSATPPSDGGAPADPAAAKDLYDRALEAQRLGDWAEYGSLIDQLGEVLAELSGSSVEATTAPAD